MEQNNTIDNMVTTPKRPTFLTVLCILTFIGSGFGIFNGITTAFMSNVVSGQHNALKANVYDSLTNNIFNDSNITSEQRAGQDIAKKMMGDVLTSITPEKLRNVGLATLISSIITLLGALMMWRLRKLGFWVYVLGIIISISAPLAIYGMSNIMGALSAIGMGLVGIIFVILYAVNRKHLVN